jgi:hypothetical protein
MMALSGPQSVTHIGEIRFGPVRGLGLGLLLQIFLGEIGELLRLQFRVWRDLRVGDGRQEANVQVHRSSWRLSA